MFIDILNNHWQCVFCVFRACSRRGAACCQMKKRNVRDPPKEVEAFNSPSCPPCSRIYSFKILFVPFETLVSLISLIIIGNVCFVCSEPACCRMRDGTPQTSILCCVSMNVCFVCSEPAAEEEQCEMKKRNVRDGTPQGGRSLQLSILSSITGFIMFKIVCPLFKHLEVFIDIPFETLVFIDHWQCVFCVFRACSRRGAACCEMKKRNVRDPAPRR